MSFLVKIEALNLWQSLLQLIFIIVASIVIWIVSGLLSCSSFFIGWVSWFLPQIFFSCKMKGLIKIKNPNKQIKLFFIYKIIKLLFSFSIISIILLTFYVNSLLFILGYFLSVIISTFHIKYFINGK